MNKHSMLYKTLARALSIKRPHNSIGTQELTAWLINNVPKTLRTKPLVDAAGNLHIDARQGKHNRTLFVAHVDTVHRIAGPNKIRKTNTMWYAHADAPLGADDGAGVAMLMHLLHGGVPGYYIFTQGEECGGIGATHVAEHKKKLLKEFDRAIAFDRRGIDSVITHQGYGRCCSDKFAQSLADQLNDDMTLMYMPDDTGVYTDTAEFTDIIPECTNISVGYYSEHTVNEKLDIIHLQQLANRCLLIDWDNLPTDRDPSVHESKWHKSWGSWDYASHDDKTWDKGWQDKMWTTSVNNSFDPYADDDEYDREVLREAIYDAQAGFMDYLIELMCDSVYPEDPDLARKFINPKDLTEELLTQAMEWSDTYDVDTVLSSLFDASHIEA
jgi:hypothetical protein